MPEQRERDSYLFSRACSLLGERERWSALMEESKGGPRKKRERVRSLGDDDDATN